MSSVLVTGGDGFIGRHLVRKLCEDKNRNNEHGKNRNSSTVTVVDNNACFSPPVDYCGFDFYHEDIRNTSSLADIMKKHRVDTCIHLAAKVSVTESLFHPFETADVNIMGTLGVLEACSRNNVKNVVFASSAAIYGEPKSLPIREDCPPEPLSPYGASKLSGEALLFSYLYSKKIKNAIALRFFNVYGEGQNTQYAGVIKCFKEKLLSGQAPVIFGDGSQTRDFVSVNDVVKAIILATDSNDVSGSFNIGTGIPVSIMELAVMMIRSYGYNFSPILMEPKKGEVKNSVADIGKAKSLLGYRPQDAIDSLVGRIVSYPLQR